jgi:hypothetical protein
MEKFLNNQQIPLVRVINPSTGEITYSTETHTYDDRNGPDPTYLNNVIVDLAGSSSYASSSSYSDKALNSLSSSYAATASFIRPNINYGLYNQITSSTPITNTTEESSILATRGAGTLSVPAGGFTQGDAFHATLTGHISAQNNDTLQIKVKSDSVVLVDTGIIIMTGVTNKNWKMEIYFSIYDIGAAGTASIATGGNFQYTQDAAGLSKNINFSTKNTSSFDTTIDNTLEITAQWGTANTNNSIYSDICTLNKTF